MNKKSCILLLSGGLDSATTLAIANNEGFEVYALSFDYGQRHTIELECAKNIATSMNVKEHKIITLDLRSFGGSALTDNIDVPKDQAHDHKHIPITYVPARNTIFLSYALAYAESLGVFDIFIGANAIDYSGYPDCRPEYIECFEKMANLATADAVQGKGNYKIHRPLIDLTKAQIIETGLALGFDYSITISCYDPDQHGKPCGHCDSCTFRNEGFAALGMADPSL